jgi:hypothetical protein
MAIYHNLIYLPWIGLLQNLQRSPKGKQAEHQDALCNGSLERRVNNIHTVVQMKGFKMADTIEEKTSSC